MESAVGALTLFVADKARARDFYACTFDLPPLMEDDTSVLFRFANVMVNLVVDPEELIEPAPVGSGTTAMVTIWVESCDDTVALLRERGVEFVNGPVDRPWGQRTAAFLDPDGHAWEIAQEIR